MIPGRAHRRRRSSRRSHDRITRALILFWLAGLTVDGLLYFGLTAARDLQPFDSGEFALNAVQFGMGHPPGQPLYLIASALAVRLLPVSPPMALSLLSVIATVATALLCAWLAMKRSHAHEPGRVHLAAIAAVAAAAVYLVPGVWDMATRAEVYPLAALCLVAATALLLVQLDGGGDGSEKLDLRRLTLSFLLFAAGACVNPVMAMAAAAAVAPALVLWMRADRRRRR